MKDLLASIHATNSLIITPTEEGRYFIVTRTLINDDHGHDPWVQVFEYDDLLKYLKEIL